MHVLLLLLLFPMIWPFAAKAIWKHELTWSEHLVNLSLGVLVVIIGYFLGMAHLSSDTQILNGYVFDKKTVKVHCSHSYSCNCRETCSGSGDRRSCSTTCDTCYDHPWDFDHDLHTTVGTITIDREDRQGVKVPLRFKQAQINDPVAKKDSYENLIKAAPESLFNEAQNRVLIAQFADELPPYPANVYDYHYVDRVIAVGFQLPEATQWNLSLAKMLNKLGAQKQVNVVVVLTKNKDPNYANALAASWLGGKKNDVIAVLGVPDFPKIQWARVISWTDSQLFKVELRDSLMAVPLASPESVLPVISHHIEKSFVHKPMRDFEYLKPTPPMWLILLLFFSSAAISIGITIWLVRNDTNSH